MKRVDVTKSVMENVARYERERSTGWLQRFRVIIVALLLLAVFILGRVWQQLQERGSLDLLSLFWEDAEIIREFWQDTLSIFLEEIPQETLLGAVWILLGIVMFVWLTRKRRKIIKRRLSELAKRKKK